jgi:type IV pilus assembly protein PilM
LRELIQDEASKYLPFDNMDDVNYDFQILGKNESNASQIDVMLVAAKTDIVNRFTDAIENAGLQPVIMDVDSFALETMYEENYDFGSNEIVALVNIGASVTNINVVKNGGSILRRDFTMAGYSITADLQSNMSLLSFEDAEIKKLEGYYDEPTDAFRGHLINAAEPILQEIERSIDYFRSTVGGGEINKILLSGGSASLLGFAEALSQRLNITTEIVNPFKHIAYSKKQFSEEEIERIGPAAAVCIGLALRMVGDK